MICQVPVQQRIQEKMTAYNDKEMYSNITISFEKLSKLSICSVMLKCFMYLIM